MYLYLLLGWKRSQHFLASQLCLVLFFDAQLLQLGELLTLDGFHFVAFVCHLFAELAAFLEVIKSIKLLLLVVVQDLVADALGVIVLRAALLLLKLALMLFLVLLLLNHAQEGVAFGLRLLCHHDLTLQELLFACDFQLVYLASSLQSSLALLLAGLALTFFEGSLGSESINLSLTIGSLLLHSSEAGDFVFFLFFDASLLNRTFFFFEPFLFVVTDNFQIFISLSSLLFSFLLQSDFVAFSNFLNQLLVSQFLSFGSSDLLLAQFFRLSHHLLTLHLHQLSLLDALDFALLNLVNDHKSAGLLGLHALSDGVLLFLQSFEAFDFHHHVEFFLLLNPLLLELFVFFKLNVADSDDLRVQTHFVHVFYVVELLVHLALRLAQETVIMVNFVLLIFRWGKFLRAFFVHFHHSLFTFLGCGHLGLLLSCEQALVGFNVFTGLNFGGALDAFELLFGENCSFSVLL